MEVWEVGEHWNDVIITGMFAGRTQERSAFVLRSAFSSQISVDAHTHTQNPWDLDLPAPAPGRGCACAVRRNSSATYLLAWPKMRVLAFISWNKSLQAHSPRARASEQRKRNKREEASALSSLVYTGRKCLFTFLSYFLSNMKAMACLSIPADVVWS